MGHTWGHKLTHGHTWKIGLPLQKLLTLGKMWSHLENWVTFVKMGHTWKKWTLGKVGTHLQENWVTKFDPVVKNGSRHFFADPKPNFPRWPIFSKCDTCVKSMGHTYFCKKKCVTKCDPKV